MPVHLTLPQLTVSRPAGGGLLAGEVLQQWFDHAGRLVASGGRRAEAWWMQWPHLATFTFGADGPVTAVPSAPGLGETIDDIFRRGVTPVVLLARGFEALHASAVVCRGGVIALCGTSGTGKSTIGHALAARGLPHFADDTVVYHVDDGRPFAIALPFTPRLDDAAAAAIIRTDPTPVTPTQSFPLRTVYHLVRDTTVDPRAPQFEPVNGTGRFERLLRHAHPFEMGDDTRVRSFVDALLVCSREVSICDCRFAPDLAALPDLAEAIAAHAEVWP